MSVELEYIARIIVAGICGFVLGYERKGRLKNAGVRTHMIVAMGAALILIVSKYGFNDILGVAGVSLNPAQIAGQIVSGIGFLGAGVIFARNGVVNGLTTAAGVWAVAGVGMAIGSGMYIIGVATTIIILIVQSFLHASEKWMHLPSEATFVFKLKPADDVISTVMQAIEQLNIETVGFESSKQKAHIDLQVAVKIKNNQHITDLLIALEKEPVVQAISCAGPH
jgi:putative Mg2+ transporter-C (MgtC) family protein